MDDQEAHSITDHSLTYQKGSYLYTCRPTAIPHEGLK